MIAYNITSMNRKKYKRRMNKCVRESNKALKKDWLWDGRFTIRQLAADFQPFEDHSGARYVILAEITDHKTGFTAQKLFDNFDIDYWLPWWINSCIVEKFKVWDEKPNPYEQAAAAGRKPDIKL